MSQVHKSTIGQPIRVGQLRYAAAATLAASITAAVVAGVFIFGSLASAPAAVRTPQYGQFVDGWMPAAVGARVAQLQAVQDGYLPGLMSARQDGDPVDGYFPALTAARGGDPTDGWMPGLTGRGPGTDLRDGWEASLSR